MDSSCYGVLCKMSQSYLMRYPLIIGQGSLGTQENNEMRASSRYTEAKPSIYTDLMMNDFKKDVVPLKETYNGEYMEPVVLPGLFPNAICNGRQAIGISMSHNSLPHNLREVCDAIIAYIKNNNLTLDELLNIMPGPDFPLPNVIINKNDIKEAYRTGHSATSLKVRGMYEIKDNKIIFTSIPYRTYRNKIKEQIEKNVDQFENIIEDFNDESALGNNKLVFTLVKGANIQVALNKIFALTDLQTTVSYNMNFIVNGTPKLCSLLDMIKYYVEHQIEVLLKATEYDKIKAEKRKHILEGLILILDNIDRAIELIRNSKDTAEAKIQLIKEFSIDEEQAKAILDMKLARLTKLDKNNLLEELEEKKIIIAECNKIINEEDYRNLKLIEKIQWLKAKYGDERRTELAQIEIPKEEKEIAYVEPEKCVVVMTESGLIKRIPTASFRKANRNTKGVKTQDDITHIVIRTNTIDNLMIFSNKGMMYRLLVDNIPVGTNASQGTNIKALVPMAADETPATIYSIYRETDAKYVLFATKNGLVKRTSLEEYTKTKKKSGLQATKINDDDELVSVSLMDNEDIVMLTKQGMSIHFKGEEISIYGRTAAGLKGINLKEGDEVVAALPIRDTKDNVAIFTENGVGKQVALSDFTLQKRGGKGVAVSKLPIAAASMLNNGDKILIMGDKNNLCISGEDIPVMGRTAQGVQLIKDNKIISVSKV